MGLFGRWARKPDAGRPLGAASNPVMSAGAVSADEQAIARYRYLLRTAPPEQIEAAHAEAFAQLTPEQRSTVLAAMGDEVPAPEREAALRDGASATALARAATRAELRRPGAMERMLGGPSGGVGLGGLMAGTMLSTMAGMVLGSAIAHHFFDQHPPADAPAADASGESAWSDASADAGDAGGDFGDFDGGFDVYAC
jgi:hypothetical protein